MCGSSNNGSDGFAIVRLLKITGYLIQNCFIFEKISLTKDALTNYRICQIIKIPLVNQVSADVSLDCIFEMDLTRVIPKPDASWIEQINKQEHCTIDAIDIPSGIDSKTEEGLDIFML